jgi:glucokinase
MQKYIIGLDLGGTVTKIGLFNFQDRLLRQTSLVTQKFPTRNSLISAICKEIDMLISQAKCQRRCIKAIGMGLPGLIDSSRGLVYYFPNIDGWKNTPIKKIFEAKLGIPVFADNDVNLMTLAEFKRGAGRGAKNLICITLGTGVGGGLIINGELYRGSKLAAGEIGHVPIEFNGLNCNCGGQGCLEAYVGNKNLIKLAKKDFGKRITLETLEKKAKAGNKLALKIWRQAGERIGSALTGVINLLNPERVIIGGGVAKAGDVLFNSIRKTVKNNAMPVQAKAVKILPSKLGYNAGLLGAVIFARMNCRG